MLITNEGVYAFSHIHLSTHPKTEHKEILFLDPLTEVFASTCHYHNLSSQDNIWHRTRLYQETTNISAIITFPKTSFMTTRNNVNSVTIPKMGI